MPGPHCPHCGADLAGIGFAVVETDDDDDQDDDDELADDEGPE